MGVGGGFWGGLWMGVGVSVAFAGVRFVGAVGLMQVLGWGGDCG